MNLAEIIHLEHIRVPLQSTTKQDCIAELVDLLAAGGRVLDRNGFLQAVMDREKLRTTGIGKGLAIPHGKSKHCTGLVMAVGKPAAPIPFDAIDQKPVWIIALLGTPPELGGLHIQALAKLTRISIIEKNRLAFQTADSAAALYHAMMQADAAL